MLTIAYEPSVGEGSGYFAWAEGDYLAKLQLAQSNCYCPSYACLPMLPAWRTKKTGRSAHLFDP